MGSDGETKIKLVRKVMSEHTFSILNSISKMHPGAKTIKPLQLIKVQGLKFYSSK